MPGFFRRRSMPKGVYSYGLDSGGRLANVDEEARRWVKPFDDAGFPIYGLAGWTGARSLGSSNIERRSTTACSLVHGTEGSRPFVIVGSSLSRDENIPLSSGRQIYETIVVEDSQIRAVSIERDSGVRVLRCHHSGVSIELELFGFEPAQVELVAVMDFQPYLDGLLRLLNGPESKSGGLPTV